MVKHGSSLNEVSRQLKASLGEFAPTRLTLHRHSEQGLLTQFICRRTESRNYYDSEGLIKFYLDSIKTGNEVNPQTKNEPTSTIPKESLDQTITLAIAPLLVSIADIAKDVTALTSLRNTLMLKYDAENSQLRSRLEHALAENSDLKRARDLEQGVMKLRVDVGRLTSAVERITNQN